MKDSDNKEIMTMSEEGFHEDSRYKQCNKEAMYGVILGITNLIWWFGFGYGLGDKPVSEYSYILRFPTWFFMSSLAGAVVLTLVLSLLAFIIVSNFTEKPSDETIELFWGI